MEDKDTALVWRLSGILAGDELISAGKEFIAEDVDMHMDGYRFKDISTWMTWLRFIRSRPRVKDLNLIERRVVVKGDRIHLSGRWSGYINGEYKESDEEGGAVYRVKEGKIVEIWTTRTNYPFMFGNMMKYNLGWLAVLTYLYFWSKLYKPLVDWDQRLPARRPETPSPEEVPVAAEA